MKLHKYTTNNKEWTLREEFDLFEHWTSNWFSDDGDGVSLYISKDKSGFELFCFSGIPASHIYIDIVDYGTLWRKAFSDLRFGDYNYDQQSIMLANWFCEKYCEYKD